MNKQSVTTAIVLVVLLIAAAMGQSGRTEAEANSPTLNQRQSGPTSISQMAGVIENLVIKVRGLAADRLAVEIDHHGFEPDAADQVEVSQVSEVHVVVLTDPVQAAVQLVRVVLAENANGLAMQCRSPNPGPAHSRVGE